MNSMKKGLLASALIAAGGMLGSVDLGKRYHTDNTRKVELFTFSQGHYRGSKYNKIKKRRNKNKMANKSRRINR